MEGIDGMRLYDSLGPNPQIVRTFLAEKGLAEKIERVTVDIMGGENRGHAFRAVNPMGQMPALELAGGQVVTEVVVICELLEEMYPQPALIGNDPAERAETRMWVRRFDLGVVEPFMMGFRATVGRGFFAPRMALLSEAAGAEVLGLMNGNLTQLDALLAGRIWVCGARFGLADILLGAILLFSTRSGVPLPDGLLWVPGWLARCEARGTFAA
jgi:glutathione S-transferase